MKNLSFLIYFVILLLIFCIPSFDAKNNENANFLKSMKTRNQMPMNQYGYQQIPAPPQQIPYGMNQIPYAAYPYFTTTTVGFPFNLFTTTTTTTVSPLPFPFNLFTTTPVITTVGFPMNLLGRKK
ncbi:hypothetical protein PVAND_013048 [Polypedilum vanderplanki]|uniref:Uncharacterized protein n=1 Tax=Polypedilum vanderplanki TaxID=319348 RepID=A0A9J6CP99_POLVA|nr:hypothetical protein PVAND_013048 [Polypedilum vanderplanki]